MCSVSQILRVNRCIAISITHFRCSLQKLSNQLVQTEYKFIMLDFLIGVFANTVVCVEKEEINAYVFLFAC